MCVHHRWCNFFPQLLTTKEKKTSTFKKSFTHSCIHSAVLCLSCGMRCLRCIMWNLSLWLMDSLVMVWGLSCSHTCRILVPWPGIEPTSLALQGGFLTTGPPGKSPLFFFNKNSLNSIWMPGPVFRASHFFPWPATQKQTPRGRHRHWGQFTDE